jgi:hypothetical protein
VLTPHPGTCVAAWAQQAEGVGSRLGAGRHVPIATHREDGAHL